MKTVTPRLADALIGFKDFIKHDYYSKWSGTEAAIDETRYDVEFEEGSKYVKVVSISWGSRSVHCFVEKANGKKKGRQLTAQGREFLEGVK